MRIAAYHNLPSGGAKRALFNYTKGLVEAGHIVDVYAPPTANEEFLDLHPLAHLYETVPIRIYTATSRWGLVRHARVAAQAIDAGRYDVAFVHHCQFTQSPYVLRFLRTPSVYYCQEPRRTSFEYSMREYAVAQASRAPPLRRLLRTGFEGVLRRRDIEAARSATLILANSFYSVESIKRAYGHYAPVAYLGTDLGAFRASGRARANAVLSVGALHPTKGHALVIDAVGALADDPDRPAVHIVADRAAKAYGRQLEERADALGVTVSIHEGISDDELIALYSTSRVAVCAAELEPFGFTPLEAMACGTPVVAVREGGYKETVIDGYNGRLIERDPRQLAEAIAALLADGSEWERLSVNALADVGRWSVERATATLERFLVDVARAR